MSNITIKIGAKTDEFNRRLAEVQKRTQRLEAGLSKAAKMSGIAFAGLSAAIGGAVAVYRTQEQAEIKTRQTIEATGGAAGLTAKEIFKMAGALQEVTTFGDEAIIGGQNLLLTFKNIGGETFPRATEVMLDMSEAMGQDLKGSAIQLGKALNDPITGVSALAEVGITFTEQQKAQIKALSDSGDVASAQAIILKELESQFGGVARASAEGTGQLIQLKNIFGDLIEDIGRQFVPVLVAAAQPLKNLLTAIRENEAIAKTAAAFVGVGAALAAVVGSASAGALVFLKLRAAIIAVGGATKILSVGVKGLVGATGIGLLVLLASELITNWSAVEEFFYQFIDGTTAAFRSFSENIGGMARSLGKLLAGIFTFDTDKIKAGYSELKDALSESFDEIAEEVREKEAERRAEDLERRDEENQQDIERTRNAEEAKTKVVALGAQQKEQVLGSSLSQIASLESSNNKALVVAGKAAGIAKATISTFQGATEALKLGPFLGPPLAAAIKVAGFANIAKIAGVKLAKGGFAEFQAGGRVSGGVPNVDSVPALLQRGEFVAPAKSADDIIDARARELSGSGQAIDVNINFNEEEFGRLIDVTVNERRALGTGAI